MTRFSSTPRRAVLACFVCQWAKSPQGDGDRYRRFDDEKPRWPSCAAAIIPSFTRERVSSRVRELTGGEGWRWFDSIGRILLDSLACLRPMGMMVSFGTPLDRWSPSIPGCLADGLAVPDPTQPVCLFGSTGGSAGDGGRVVYCRALRTSQLYPSINSFRCVMRQSPIESLRHGARRARPY